MAQPQANWAGNIMFEAKRFHQPTSAEQLHSLVAGCEHVRALGTSHSFNRIADTSGDLVSVANLPSAIEVDADQATVTVD